MADEDQLSAQAKAFGVETSYYDALGTQRTPSAEALREIVNVLEIHAREAGAVATPPVRVVRQGGDGRLDNACGDGGGWRLVEGDREVAHGACHGHAITLPAELRVGSYRLLAGHDPKEGQPLIVAPPKSYQPAIFDDGRRVWLLAVQLYSLRSRRNWGIGDFTDLKTLVQIAGMHGAAGIGLNPLHTINLDDPGMISPYSPSSRLFLNVLYVDVEAAPEFPGLAAAGLAEEVERLRASELVDYAGVIAAKLKGLRLAYDAFRERGSPERRADFDAFKRERGATLGGYAAFTTLHRKFGPPWWNWPEEWRNPTAEKIDELWRSEGVEMDFHAYMQWLADRQLRACAVTARELSMPVGLYLDVAVGVSANSADVWNNQGAYVRELSAGAPPDMLNTFGQDWGLASLHPSVLAHTDFSLLRETLRAIMRHAGAIRIDHVLGFNRLYMIPHGHKPFEGTYVRFPFEAMLAVLAQESNAERCIVVGEDLGTVPEGFREKLAEWNVWSYRVMIFERVHDGSFKPPSDYPAPALVSFATHDLPTFSGWLSNHDLEVKRGLGMDPGETEADRERAHRAMAAALARDCGSDKPSTPEMIRYLARTPSRLLVVAAEDVFDILDQVNVPGTINEHPNWRRRLSVSLEDFAADSRLSAVADVLRHEGRAIGSGEG